jgi:hypothetical protein
MMMSYERVMAFLVVLCALFHTQAFSIHTPLLKTASKTVLQAVPLELEGWITPGNKWEVKFIFNGEEKVVEVPEDQCLLESAEAIFDGVDSSCRNGVCTTCAGQVS